MHAGSKMYCMQLNFGAKKKDSVKYEMVCWYFSMKLLDFVGSLSGALGGLGVIGFSLMYFRKNPLLK